MPLSSVVWQVLGMVKFVICRGHNGTGAGVLYLLIIQSNFRRIYQKVNNSFNLNSGFKRPVEGWASLSSQSRLKHWEARGLEAGGLSQWPR